METSNGSALRMTETSTKRGNLERDRREKSVARGARVLDLNLK